MLDSDYLRYRHTLATLKGPHKIDDSVEGTFNVEED